MTEKEYLLEMLCCLPKELILLKLNNSNNIPKWLKGIDNATVKEALDIYDTPKYVNIRKRQEEILN